MIRHALPQYVSTRNACKLCTPLGASLAFSGIEGCVPFLHGSQGCATYIRRYMISHYREPMDIASSNFGEQAAVFGGRTNLHLGLANVIEGYDPKVIGIATTCLAETIGDDVKMLLHEFREANAGRALPEMVHVSTPSYAGTHAEGYHAAIRATVEQLAEDGEKIADQVNIIPGMVSPADLRYLHELAERFGLKPVLLPDYADRLDGPSWKEYQRIPEGGTSVEQIRSMGRSVATIELASTLEPAKSAGRYMEEKFGVTHHMMDLPVGVRGSDALMDVLSQVSGRAMPERDEKTRGRLVDSYVDAHKYVFGKRVIVYGEEDLVVALSALLSEVGMEIALAASGGESGKLREAIGRVTDGQLARGGDCRVENGIDFEEIAERAADVEADLVIGHSKGQKLAQRLGLPLIRVGFPVHDRFGGARIATLGYDGTQALFDRMVNEILAVKQAEADVPFTYF